MGCLNHTFQMHRHIQYLAVQYHLSTGGKSVVPAVALTCDEVDAILASVIARAPNHAIGHKASPVHYVLLNSPHLSCSYCGSLLTLEAEDAYREIILHLSSSQKQSPR